MTQAKADLLALACHRIEHLDRPAYIKDHMLRYVTVNDAFRMLAASPPNLSSDNDEVRNEAERRARDSDDTLCYPLCQPGDTTPLTMEVERFITDDGSVYLFGQAVSAVDMARLPLSIKAVPVGTGDAVRASVENALEMLDVGLAIFDADDRLIYRNGYIERLYSPFIGSLDEGTSLRDLYGRLHQSAVRDRARHGDPDLPPRDAWVADRLKIFAVDYSESTEQICDGRWLRCVNRRLENGLLLLVRLDISDLKAQELLLRDHVRQNEIYHSIIEELPVAVFARGRDHRMVFANAAFSTLFGYERDRLIGQTELEAYGDEGPAAYDTNERVFNGAVVTGTEEPFHRADGQSFETLTRIIRVVTDNADTFLVGSVLDITELKQREVALREAQERAETLSDDLRGILSALPVGVLVFDARLMVEYANESFFEVCGMSASVEISSEPVHHAIEMICDNARFGDGDDDSLAEKLSLLFERGSEASVEFCTRDGRSVIAVSRNLSGGKTLVTFADISALREHEREIGETQKQLENIGQFMQEAARVMSQGLLVVENDRIILSNPAAAEILHLPLAMVSPGEPMLACFNHCVDRGDFGEAMNPEDLLGEWVTTLRETGSLQTSFMAAGKSWVQAVVTVGEGGHVMVVVNDLTEMKRREGELEQLLARSEAADRAKSEFLANMGHEIRTPMNGVLGMAELLAKTDLDARQRTFTEIITKSAGTLLTIFNDILDFSKIDAGRMELKMQPFDVVEALEDVSSLHAAAASEKNVDLLVRFGGALPKRIIGDAGRFRQIVSNFVSNAIRHTDRGHVLVEMLAEPLRPGWVTLTVRVEDTGIGVKPEKLATIFEKFSHAGASESRHSESTGLGLAITSGLVTLFGGSIGAESTPGKGSTFTVALPMQVVDTAGAIRPVPAQVSGARILVVDDNDISRAILTGHLESWGFDCCAADSAAMAFSILQAARELGVTVDAILVDHHMAEMDGAEFCRQVRGDHDNDGVALVVLTSLDAASDVTLLESLQVQAHLTKPARANILRNTIIEVLRARHQRQQAGDGLETINAFAARLPAFALDMPDLPEELDDSAESSRVRIVVAEDNEVNAIVFSQILGSAGHVFAMAGNGEEAIALWQQHQPDVILMDVSMPVMDGLEATRRIRHMERVADLQPVAIIAVTAHDTPSGRELCLKHGMDDYLAKPISPEMLEAKLSRWLPGADRSEMPGE